MRSESNDNKSIKSKYKPPGMGVYKHKKLRSEFLEPINIDECIKQIIPWENKKEPSLEPKNSIPKDNNSEKIETFISKNRTIFK